MSSVLRASQMLIVGRSRVGAWLIALAVLCSMLVPASSAMASDTNMATSGLFDEAGVLTDAERSLIEDRIREVELAGAPAVVYLRLFHTENDRAVRDAQQLMEDRDVESAPGAHDGVVMYFNLDPDEPTSGEFAIVAGETHYDGGPLPQSELNRIRDRMIDLLADDQLAEGIVLGLELTAERLEAGPPEPTALESFLKRIATGPFSLVNITSIFLAAVLGLIGWRTWQDRPQAPYVYRETVTEPPEDLHPALAGGLVRGRIDHSQIEAIILELGRRGALAFEPDLSEREKVQIRLIDASIAESPYESSLMEILSDDAENGVLSQDALSKTQRRWDEVQEIVRSDLEERGWFDPESGSRRLPLILTGGLGFVLGIAAFVPLPVIEEPWVLLGAFTLVILGMVLLIMASAYPRTSLEGARQAAPWQGYREGLKQAARQEYGQLDLDEAFPYIASLALTDEFHDHLEKASESGYVPAWLTRTDEVEYLASNWFVYWVAFHSVVTPQSTSGTGSTPGGAATGSGGAGGRF